MRGSRVFINTLRFWYSKKLGRVFITLDHDFSYYEETFLKQHPGIILVSTSSVVPETINKICEKALRLISPDFCNESLVLISNDKIVKKKEGKIIFEKKYTV